MSTFDWSRFMVRVNIKTSTEKLYHSWATRAGMEYWFLRMSEYKNPDGTLRNADEFVKKGDTYSWRWHGWPDDMTEYGEVLECNGKDMIKFSFGNAGNCTIKIYEEQGEKIVELVQDEIPTTEEGMRNWHLGVKPAGLSILQTLNHCMKAEMI